MAFFELVLVATKTTTLLLLRMLGGAGIVREECDAVQGACVAVASAVLIGRLNGASPDLGLNYELHIIAGVVLGGTALYGGVGSILGTVLGILTIGIVENAMVLIRADFHLQRVLIGALLVAAVAYQGHRRRRAGISE